MPRRPTRAALALAGVALALAACASPSTSPTDAVADPTPADTVASMQPSTEPSPSETAQEPGTALTACEIVTPADIEAAVGLDAGMVAESTSSETPTVLSPGHTSCLYNSDTWGGVSIELTPEDGVNLYDAARDAYDDASDMVVVGSDGAFWSSETGRAFVWKGPVTAMLQIGFLSVENPDRAAIFQALADSIIAKLDA